MRILIVIAKRYNKSNDEITQTLHILRILRYGEE